MNIRSIKLLAWLLLVTSAFSLLTSSLESSASSIFIFLPITYLSLGVLREIRDWAWTSSLYLAFVVITAVIYFLAGGLFPWCLSAIISALLYWDLIDFHHRVSTGGIIHNEVELTRQHLLRLAIVLILTGLMIAMPFVITFRISFGWTLLILVFLGLGLQRLIRWHHNQIG